jgi:hypothetical protein
VDGQKSEPIRSGLDKEVPGGTRKQGSTSAIADPIALGQSLRSRRPSGPRRSRTWSSSAQRLPHKLALDSRSQGGDRDCGPRKMLGVLYLNTRGV